MPSVRAVGLAVGVGVGVGAYLTISLGVPTFLAVAIGATMTIVLLLLTASLAETPAAADAAWRAAAPDLVRRERREHGEEPEGVTAAVPDDPPR